MTYPSKIWSAHPRRRAAIACDIRRSNFSCASRVPSRCAAGARSCWGASHLCARPRPREKRARCGVAIFEDIDAQDTSDDGRLGPATGAAMELMPASGATKPFLITHYLQPSSHGTKQEHTTVSAGLNDRARAPARLLACIRLTSLRRPYAPSAVSSWRLPSQLQPAEPMTSDFGCSNR